MAIGKVQMKVLTRIARNPETTTKDLTEGENALGRSSVYAAIDALQRDGLLEAQWDTSTRPPCRRFTATPSGRSLLDHLPPERRAAVGWVPQGAA